MYVPQLSLKINDMVAARAWRKGELVFSEYRDSVLQDEIVLKICCTTM